MNLQRIVALGVLLTGAWFLGGNAHAQTSQNVTSSAVVSTPITGGATSPLAFGSITKGQATSIGAGASGAGAFYFSGDEADNITITIPSSVNLSTNSGAGSSLTVALDRAAMKANTSNAQGSATPVNASSGSVTVALSPDGAGDGTANDGLGQVYVWIGGSVTPGAMQQRGAYSGTFTVNASYSN